VLCSCWATVSTWRLEVGGSGVDERRKKYVSTSFSRRKMMRSPVSSLHQRDLNAVTVFLSSQRVAHSREYATTTLLRQNVDIIVTSITESTVGNVLRCLISYFGFISYNVSLVEFHSIQLRRIFIIRIIEQVLDSN
jgi:hypothetical protein